MVQQPRCASILRLAGRQTLERFKFKRRSQIIKYETRRVSDLQVPKPRLELTRKSFSYKFAKVWNDIPNNIRNMESATRLKKNRLETIFLANKTSKTHPKHDLQEEQSEFI